MASWRLLRPVDGVPVFFSGYLLLILLSQMWGKRLATGMIHGDPGRALNRFNFGQTAARFFIPLWFAAGVYWLGWGSPLLGPIAHWPVETPAMIIGILPGLVAWMGLWWAQFPVDRALREQNVLSQLESDLPVFAPPTFRGYFVHKLRVQLLFVLVPWLLIKMLHDFGVLGLLGLGHTEVGRHWLARAVVRDWSEAVVSFACVLVVLLISPEILRHVLHTERLADLPLRKSLKEICARSGVNCREILIWRTQNNMGNAAVMGLIPRVRYVMLSDLLLESMTDEQIQAVFAHELGHVKHRHLIWFVVFLLSFSFAVLSLLDRLGTHLHFTANHQEIYDIASGVGCGLLMLLAYGFISRWFERQADVFAARTVQQAVPAAGPGSEPPGEHIGAAVFASALQRVALVNNIPVNARNWTHGSIAARVRYIRRFGRDPKVAEQFDRTGRRVLLGLGMLIVICTVIAVYGAVHA